MEMVKINTDLKQFIILDNIYSIEKSGIAGSFTLKKEESFLIMESLAQIGAMHVRWLHSFDSHAALLKINSMKFIDKNISTGKYILNGKLTGKSNRAFSYKMQAIHSDNTAVHGDLLFTLIEYDSVFKKDIIKNHYMEIFQCLEKNLKKG